MQHDARSRTIEFQGTFLFRIYLYVLFYILVITQRNRGTDLCDTIIIGIVTESRDVAGSSANVGKIVSLNLGPQYSILLNKDNTLLQNGQQAFKSGDFAMVGGVQLNFSVLRIYGRYNIGLSNINDIDNKEQWKSQQLQLGIGFKL